MVIRTIILVLLLLVVLARIIRGGPLYGRIIDSIMLSTARLPVREDDIEMNVARLDFAALKSHLFITRDSTWENL